MGMTKEQVLNQYGEPYNVNSSGRGGEVWNYVFNNFDKRAFIPYYGAFHEARKRRRSGMITFNSSGRVSDYQWNESNPRGASVFR
jgi:outer membrane protein assembly factor BamE (lipoprotein component of BamABCDE complex)